MDQSVYSQKKFAPFPLNKDGTINRKLLRELFFNSKHIEWVAFCREFNFDPAGNKQINTTKLIENKKKLIQERKAGELKELIEAHKLDWHKDVLQTLKDYPALADMGQQVLRYYWGEVANAIKYQKEKESRKEELKKGERFYDYWSPSRIAALAIATKTLTEAKHKSLLLDQWHIQKAQDQLQSADPETAQQQALAFEIIGADNMSKEQMYQYLSQYYDRPRDIDAELVNPDESDEQS